MTSLPTPLRPSRRAGRFALAVTAGLFALAGAKAQAIDYPTRPVTIVTPFPAGSGPDAVLRMLSERLAKQWHQPVLIENRPGAGGFIAIDAAKRAAADGHTLLQLDSEHLSALPLLYKSRNFRPLQTFEPVAVLFRTPFFVAVAADSKWRSMADLIAEAKAQPGQVSYGSWGIGTLGHLAAQQLEVLTGTRMQHVPYKEFSQLYSNVGSGEPSWAFATIPSSQGAYKAGRLRYLAAASSKRVAQLPEVPTMAESGGPAALDFIGFVVVVAPAGVMPSVNLRINTAIATALAEPEVRARLDSFAFEPVAWSPAEVRRQVEMKARLYDQLVQRGQISLE